MMQRKEVMIVLLACFLISTVSAGVGIKWDQESLLIGQGDSQCITYYVYNPWPEGSYVSVALSDSLDAILYEQDNEALFVPANTPSSAPLPVEFCFKVPSSVYPKDCKFGVFCEQTCPSALTVYEGEVLMSSSSESDESGGSSTQATVSAPLRVRVRCDASSSDYTMLYVVVAVLSLIVIYYILNPRSSSRSRGRKRRK